MQCQLSEKCRLVGSKNCTRSLVLLTTRNEFVVAAVRKVLYIWDSQTGSLVKTLDEHFARVTALLSVTSRHVNIVISVSIDKTVKVPVFVQSHLSVFHHE